MRAKEFTVEADNVFYLPKDRKVEPKPPGTTGIVKPFKGQRTLDWQTLNPKILDVAHKWFWATVKKDSLQMDQDPYGQWHDASTDVLGFEAKMKSLGYHIKINNEGNIGLEKFNGDVIVLPTQDAMNGTGWAVNLP